MAGIMDNQNEVNNQLLTVLQVAKVLSVSRSKLYGMMESGVLPYVKIGGSRRVSLKAVSRLIEDCTVTH